MRKIVLSFLLLFGLSACSTPSTDSASEADNETVTESAREMADDFGKTAKLNTVKSSLGDYQISVPIEWVDKNPYYYTTKQSETRSLLYVFESDTGGYSGDNFDGFLSGFSKDIKTEEPVIEDRTLNGVKTKYIVFPAVISGYSGKCEAYFFLDNNDGNICLISFFSNDNDPADHSKDFENIAKTLKLLTPETTATSTPEPTPEPTPEATPEPKEEVTMGMKNALKSADSYLRYSAFSHDGLINQLEYEGYSTEEATYAADNCGADWDEQALKCAKNYLQYTAFSYTGLIDQLEYEQFTESQAEYGADHCGADWNEQAAKCAANYLDYSSFSRSGLIDQLIYEGFTREQAEYGVAENGY